MARLTIAALQSRIAEVEHEAAGLGRQCWTYSEQIIEQARTIEALRDALKSKGSVPPKGSCTVFVDGRPFMSTFCNSVAYGFMHAIKGKGRRSLYRPNYR